MSKKTSTGVDNLVNFMIKKYGLCGAIYLLKREYLYEIKKGNKSTKFTDKNEYSSFYNQSVIVRRYLTEEETNFLKEVLRSNNE